MPTTMRQAVLSLIFKKGNRASIQNYRPISLNNYDYKILAFILSKRLQKVIGKLVNPDQTGYIKGRFIGDNARHILDIFDLVNATNKSGAIITLDFQKAFDSLEWDLMHHALKRYNFGQNFLRWISILYQKPSFIIKNNGWLSKEVTMSRGIRQGCPISALLFILSTEIMNEKIRKSPDIKGIEVHNGVSKLFAYADDTTLTPLDESSVTAALHIIDQFGKYSGLTLNRDKCMGIWLGRKKDSCARYENIRFTNEPVKCMGIYFGHQKELLYNLNWERKLLQIDKLLNSWKHRKLTLFGKVLIIKSLAMSQLTYNFSILPIEKMAIKKVESMIYNFLWGKKERIKRRTLIGKYEEGGICMPDVESIAYAAKAKWLCRIYNIDSWQQHNLSYHVLNSYLEQVGLCAKTLLKCNFTNEKEIGQLSIPVFYKEVFFAYNKCKFTKSVEKMNNYDFLSQIIWCNNMFKFNGKCILFRNWINCGIIFVKDLFKENGQLLSSTDIFGKLESKHNWMFEYRTIVKVLKPFINMNLFDFTYCKYINVTISDNVMLSDGIKTIDLNSIWGRQQQFFYQILVSKKYCRPYIEKAWQKEFVIHIEPSMWRKIYLRVCFSMCDKKLCEFRYKLLHNLLICNSKLYKWKCSTSDACYYCSEAETTRHQLYECTEKRLIWHKVGATLNVSIKWKHLVLGFDDSNITGKTRNLICSIIMYAIYIHCYNMKEGTTQCLKHHLTRYLTFYSKVIDMIYIPMNFNKELYNKVLISLTN